MFEKQHREYPLQLVEIESALARQQKLNIKKICFFGIDFN
jgi:hypothetical protein